MTLKPGSRRPDHVRHIRASEISEYAYCPRAWWLENVLGMAGGNVREREHGLREHRAHGVRVTLSRIGRAAALFLLAAGVLVLVVAVLARLAR